MHKLNLWQTTFRMEKYNARCMSPEIQNELISLFADQAKKQIIFECRNPEFLCRDYR
jgi:hypothetical protein